MKINTVKLFGSALLIGLLGTGCSSTRMTEVMNDADSGVPVSNILVIGVSNVPDERLDFEYKFVKALQATGAKAVASSTLFEIGEDEKLDKDAILKIMKEQGNDAVIVTSYLGEDDTPDSYKEPTDVNSFYGRYDHAQAYASSSQSVEQKRVYLQTDLFRAETETLIWSGTSISWNPKSQETVFDEVLKKVTKDLQKDGLIK